MPFGYIIFCQQVLFAYKPVGDWNSLHDLAIQLPKGCFGLKTYWLKTSMLDTLFGMTSKRTIKCKWWNPSLTLEVHTAFLMISQRFSICKEICSLH